MVDDKVKSEPKSEVATHKPRDQEGHFVHTDPPQNLKSQKDPISHFFSEHTHYSKAQDNLLDVHVGNPLRKITRLLEDLKKQKAFSFTLKGSLGIMGVFLALSVFGILGGGQILCNRGEQTHNRTVLVKNDETIISLPYSSKVDLTKFSNYPVIATGNYNSCSQTLTITDAKAIEIYPETAKQP